MLDCFTDKITFLILAPSLENIKYEVKIALLFRITSYTTKISILFQRQGSRATVISKMICALIVKDWNKHLQFTKKYNLAVNQIKLQD